MTAAPDAGGTYMVLNHVEESDQNLDQDELRCHVVQQPIVPILCVERLWRLLFRHFVPSPTCSRWAWGVCELEAIILAVNIILERYLNQLRIWNGMRPIASPSSNPSSIRSSHRRPINVLPPHTTHCLIRRKS